VNIGEGGTGEAGKLGDRIAITDAAIEFAFLSLGDFRFSIFPTSARAASASAAMALSPVFRPRYRMRDAVAA